MSDRVVRHPLDEKELARMDRERWQRDRVDELPDGFTLKRDGRCGSIYFRRGSRVLELHYELSGDPGYDILLWNRQLSSWVLPEREPLTADEQRDVRAALERWLAANHTRALFDDPK